MCKKSDRKMSATNFKPNYKESEKKKCCAAFFCVADDRGWTLSFHRHEAYGKTICKFIASMNLCECVFFWIFEEEKNRSHIAGEQRNALKKTHKTLSDVCIISVTLPTHTQPHRGTRSRPLI